MFSHVPEIGQDVAVSGDEGPNTRTEAAQRSRQRLLELGVEILYEGLQSPIVGVSAADVVARSEWSAGAFYHHWKTQQAFRADLRQHIAGELDLAESLKEVIDAVTDLASDPSSTIRFLFRQYVRGVLEDRAWWLQVAMLASIDESDHTTVGEQMTSTIDLLERFYVETLTLFDLEMRPGFSVNWLNRSIMAVVDGYSLQLRAGLPTEMDTAPPNDPEWEVTDLALAALVAVSVQRINDQGDQHLDSVWNKLFDRKP